MSLKRFGRRVVDRLRSRAPAIWYHPEYRLTLPGLRHAYGLEPRRADYVAWFLIDQGVVTEGALRPPQRVRYEDIARIHTPAYLDSLNDPEVVARVMGVDAVELARSDVMRTLRLACGATVSAALAVARDGGDALNLLGGFHHASPDRGSGFCLINDIAVAVARLRAEGFAGRVAVIDLDAHPPDGTVACLADDPQVWIGSLSGTDWGPLPPADETVLPDGCGDATYLKALDGLLDRMPEPEMAFVIAGGDVLAGDKMGALGMSQEGARARDLRVDRALAGVPTVWMPGGGYGKRAWRVLAGTALTVTGHTERVIPESYSPLDRRFAVVAGRLEPEKLGETELFSMEDMHEALGMPIPARTRLLDYYTAEGLEYALYRYGLLPHLQRLGYGDFEVKLDEQDSGDRIVLTGRADDEVHVLVELVLSRKVVGEDTLLFVHWLNLRHPRAAFGPRRPKLPGQDVPGLGMVRDVVTMLHQAAERLHLAGLCYQPAYLHTAFVGRRHFRYLDPGRQGRFLALLRDLAGVPLVKLTNALSDGRVTLNGEPYIWEPGLMVRWEKPRREIDDAEVAAARDESRFALLTG